MARKASIQFIINISMQNTKIEQFELQKMHREIYK